jgi:hypothetical protein
VSHIDGCACRRDIHTRDLLAGGTAIDKPALTPTWAEATTRQALVGATDAVERWVSPRDMFLGVLKGRFSLRGQ